MSKILKSEYRDYINDELMKGTSTRQLSENLKAVFGFEISHNALREYHVKHLDGKKNESTPEQRNVPIIPIALSNDANEQVLADSYQIALQVTRGRLKLHVDGEVKFPTEEIKGLKTLDDILKSNQMNRK